MKSVDLVVRRTTPVDPAVADLGLERRRCPEARITGWLDVEVGVQQHVRRIGRVDRCGGDPADDERLAFRRHELGLAAAGDDQVTQPFGARDARARWRRRTCRGYSEASPSDQEFAAFRLVRAGMRERRDR